MPAEVRAETLLELAARFGTPLYAYDLDLIQEHLARLRESLPQSVEVLYSIKANPFPDVVSVFADAGLGADVASIGEWLCAQRAGFCADRIVIGGPYKSPKLLAHIRPHADVAVSVDSIGELEAWTRRERRPLVLRLRPDFPSHARCSGPLRFGIAPTEVTACRDLIRDGGLDVAGFHVHCGSQVLGTEGLIEQFRRSFLLTRRASAQLGLRPRTVNLGGGFGVPQESPATGLDLDVVGRVLSELSDEARPATIMLELGRFLVGRAGWYLTTVVGIQTVEGRPAVVVDGGVHQRADLCGLDLRGQAPIVLTQSRRETASSRPTDVLGCLCLADDVLSVGCVLPPLVVGDVLAFPGAGAYGATASPLLFLGHPAPVEVAFAGGKAWPGRPLLGSASDLTASAPERT